MKEAAHSEYISSNVRRVNPEAVFRYLIEAGDVEPAESTIQKISRAFGIGCGDVRGIIRKNDLQERLEDHMFGKKLNDPQVMELYKQGKSDYQIAKALDVTGPTICAWRKKRNLPPNFQPGCRGQNNPRVGKEPSKPVESKPVVETKKPNNSVSVRVMTEKELWDEITRLELENAELRGFKNGVQEAMAILINTTKAKEA